MFYVHSMESYGHSMDVRLALYEYSTVSTPRHDVRVLNMFGPPLDHHWDISGVTLGSPLSHIRVTSVALWGSLWGHFGGHFGVTLGALWGHFGGTLGVLSGSLPGHLGGTMGDAFGI